MRLLLLPCRLLAVASVISLIPSATPAQTGMITNDTSTPTPGVGHDYIKMLAETVNLSSGSVSVRIGALQPQGRGLGFPFSINYDSTMAHYLLGSGPPGSDVWTSARSFLASGGWSYGVPMVTNTSTTQVVSGQTCHIQTGYTFHDAQDAQEQIPIAWYPAVPPHCTNHTQYNAAGELYRAAFYPTVGSSILIADHDGTTYTFPFQGCSVGGQTIGSTIPTSIEDRNGNVLTVTGGQRTSCAFPISVTDTLGRSLLSVSGFGATGNTVTVSGLSQPYTLTWGSTSSQFTVNATQIGSDPLGCSGINGEGPESDSVIRSITLPIGQSYTFLYGADDPNNSNPYGLLSKITYPSGGYVSYSWGLNPLSELATFFDKGGQMGCVYHYDNFAVVHRYVSFDGSTVALQQDFSYSVIWDSQNPQEWDTKTTTVVTHDLIQGTVFTSVYTYSPLNATPPPFMPTNECQGGTMVCHHQLPVEQTITAKDANGNTLLTTTKGWFNTERLNCELNQLDNGPIAGHFYIGNPITNDKQYDYGILTSTTSCANGPVSPPSATPSRETVTTYQTFNATPIFPPVPSIIDRPSSIIVYGNGTRVAEADSSYDQSQSSCAGNSTCAVSPSPVAHDETHYVATSTAPRGNASTITKQCFQGSTSCTNSVSVFTFDETGQILSKTDACGNTTCSDMTGSGHTTQYSYADVYSSCGGAAPPSGSTNAYLTSVTEPLGHIQSYCYGYDDGQLRGSTDLNNQTTTYKYNDSLRRLTETDFPDGGKTTIAYNDSPYNASTPSPNVTTTKAITSSTNLTTLTAFDGLGHTVRSVLTSDPDCASGDRTDTTYDGLGRVHTVSNPYCATSDPTYGLTTYTYDALGRTTQVTHPDNSTTLTTYTGRATQVQDEGNGTQRVIRISQVDGLGRHLSLCEVAPGPFVGPSGNSSSSLIGSGGTPAACGLDIGGTGFLTTYQYDALDNLLQVNQSGVAQRTFTYDSLSRLLTASNPESGTTTYSYDANGNIQTKTDARNFTTTYAYDPLNRLTGKTYSDGSPAVTFNYDQTSALGVTLTNTKGRKSVPVRRIQIVARSC